MKYQVRVSPQEHSLTTENVLKLTCLQTENWVLQLWMCLWLYCTFVGKSSSLHLIDLNFKFRFRNRCRRIAPTLQAFYQIPLISISQRCDLFLKTNELTLMSNFLKLLPHSDLWSTGCWREVVYLNHNCILSFTLCLLEHPALIQFLRHPLPLQS